MSKPNQNTKDRQFTAIIVDDEQPARELLRHLLVQRNFTIVAECANGKDAVAAIRKHMPDVLFLDIQMPGMSGFDVVESIGVEKLNAVIFVTAYDQHALRAFEVGAVDYLLKPFSLDRFSKALKRIQDRRTSPARNKRLRRMIEFWQQPVAVVSTETKSKWKQRITITEGSKVFALSVSEIDSIVSSDHYVTVIARNKKYLLYEKLSVLESELDPNQFIRIHRTVMINVNAVNHIVKGLYGNHKVRMKEGTLYPVSRSKKKELVTLMASLANSQ
jgi:two-component system LytT family response regulator